MKLKIVIWHQLHEHIHIFKMLFAFSALVKNVNVATPPVISFQLKQALNYICKSVIKSEYGNFDMLNKQ